MEHPLFLNVFEATYGLTWFKRHLQLLRLSRLCWESIWIALCCDFYCPHCQPINDFVLIRQCHCNVQKQYKVFLKRKLQQIIKIGHCLQPTATVSRTTNMQDRTPPTSREEELRRAPFSSLEPQLRPGAPPQHIRAPTKRLLTPEFRRPIPWGPIVSDWEQVTFVTTLYRDWAGGDLGFRGVT